MRANYNSGHYDGIKHTARRQLLPRTPRTSARRKTVSCQTKLEFLNIQEYIKGITSHTKITYEKQSTITVNSDGHIPGKTSSWFVNWVALNWFMNQTPEQKLYPNWPGSGSLRWHACITSRWSWGWWPTPPGSDESMLRQHACITSGWHGKARGSA